MLFIYGGHSIYNVRISPISLSLSLSLSLSCSDNQAWEMEMRSIE